MENIHTTLYVAGNFVLKIFLAGNLKDCIDDDLTKYCCCLDGQPPRYGVRVRGGRQGAGLVPGLAEDYAEIVDEEGDYSSPARDYELDRARIDLSEIIGQTLTPFHKPDSYVPKPDSYVPKPDNYVHKPDNYVHKLNNYVHKPDKTFRKSDKDFYGPDKAVFNRDKAVYNRDKAVYNPDKAVYNRA